MRRRLILTTGILVGALSVGCGGSGSTGPHQPPSIPVPSGIYVLNENSNEQSLATAYASGLTAAPAYDSDVAGHAIFVPIAKVLPSVSTWGQFSWSWTYLDSLVGIAVSHHKRFSLEFEVGFQAESTYQISMPQGFVAACGADCAHLFDVWVVGGVAPRCIDAIVPLPWIANVQQMWTALASDAAAHLKQTGAYSSLTLVHVPGLSVYDEELRLPTGTPRPTASDSTIKCPDGKPAYPTTITDADTTAWRALGYSDSAVVAGFSVIAAGFARAFPDRYLGLSLLNPGTVGLDFPNLTGDPVGQVASELVQAVSTIAPGRVQLQADDLDINHVLAEVTTLATTYGDAVGWQTNKHAGTGAGCNGAGPSSCSPDGPSGLYFQLLQAGAQNHGEYIEVWSADVVQYPQSIASAVAQGYYAVK